MSKFLNEALAVYDTHNWIYLSSFETEYPLLSDSSLADNIAIRNELYEQLSEEAKEVLAILLDTPTELLELAKKEVTSGINIHRKLFRYMLKKVHTKRDYKRKQIRNEIKHYLEEIVDA